MLEAAESLDRGEGAWLARLRCLHGGGTLLHLWD